MNIHVVTSPCVGTKDGACAKVCPVQCFFDAGDMLLIHPDECIGCGLCASECPVSAIFPDEELPEHEHAMLAKRDAFFAANVESLRVQ